MVPATRASKDLLRILALIAEEQFDSRSRPTRRTTVWISIVLAIITALGRGWSPPSRPQPLFRRANPIRLRIAATGLIDCGNWAESASWAVPADATSGVYIAKLVRTDTGGASHIAFVVRDDSSTSDLFFQTSDTTWQAYNSCGGNSLYVGSPAGRAYKVSYNRPFITRDGATSYDWLFSAEYPMIRWLEANGYNVSYTTGVDTDRRGNLLTNHKVFLSVGHDEYWSGTAARQRRSSPQRGVHLAFFSGNEVFWKTRWEPSIDGSGNALPNAGLLQGNPRRTRKLIRLRRGRAPGGILDSARRLTGDDLRTPSLAPFSWSTAIAMMRSRFRPLTVHTDSGEIRALPH